MWEPRRGLSKRRACWKGRECKATQGPQSEVLRAALAQPEVLRASLHVRQLYMCMAPLAVAAAIWAQMRFIRLAVLVICREEPLSVWLQPKSRAGVLRLATFAAQLLCIAWPSATTFAASIATTLALGWECLPYEVDNSGTYGLLADANLWCGILWAWSSGHTVEEGWQAVQPAARAIFGTTYAFAALAKLNSDYADVRKSSCTVFTLLVGEGFVPAALTRRVLALIGDAGLLLLLRAMLLLLEAIELAIPPMLAFGALSSSALLVWAFHLALGTIAYDYSVIAVASLVLCAPPEQLAHLEWMSTTPTARLVATAAALLLCHRLESGRCRELGSVEHIATLGWLCLLCPAWWVGTHAPTPPGLLAALAAGSPALPVALAASGAALLAATVVNGCGPYLGYKTVAVWAMFSNLHVEGGRTNHWLLPPWLQLVGCCRALVTVEATDAPALAQYHSYSSWDAACEATGPSSPLQLFAARTGCAMISHANSILGRGGEVSCVFPYRVPFWMLRRIVSCEVLPHTKSFYVDYSIPGHGTRRFEVVSGQLTAGSDERLARPPHVLLQKLTSFKSVPADDRDCGVCHGP